MSRISVFLATLMLCFFATVPEGRAQVLKGSPEVERMKIDYNQKRAKTLVPVLARYRADLEALSKKILLKNDLEGAVFVKKELDSLKDGSGTEKEQDAKEPEDLSRLRKESWQRAREAMKPVNAKFQADFDALAKKLAQKNDVDGAVAAKQAADALGAVVAGGQDAAATELRKAILGDTWSWASKAGERGVEMTFKTDGTVSHATMKAKWKITGPRDVSLTFDNGDKMVLRFDKEMKSYQAVGREYRGGIWE